MTSNNKGKDCLKEHYMKKIKRIAILSENKKYKQFLQYKIAMKHSFYGNVCLLIEYETTKPEYGIYFGCKCDTWLEASTCGNTLKENIWGAYKKAVYTNIQVEMEDVFLPHCEDTSEEKLFWLFWIRLEEHLNVVDALKRLSILVDIFKKNNFNQVSKDELANPE